MQAHEARFPWGGDGDVADLFSPPIREDHTPV